MKFYREFSTYYDYIFQTSPAKVEFLADQIEKGLVLDAATGTGNYAIALAQRGYSVKGVDLSKEMINQARDKIREENLNLEFKVGDMLEVSDIYSQQRFALAYCIGNSLVHLEDAQEIKELLKEFYSLLKPGAKLIIQTVNYDRILDNQVTSLPTINNREENVKLIRDYELVSKDQVDFKTKLITPQGEFENSVPLYPLRAQELKRLAAEVGFTTVDLYGDFKYSTYQQHNSFPLVAVITK